MRVFALFAILAALAAAPAPPPSNAGVGAAAPPVAGTTLGGEPFSAALTGKVQILNFWATWCPPCRAETADLVTAYRKLHSPDVAFLGIDTTETAPIVKTFLSAKGVPYPSVLAGPDVYNAYGIAYIPTTIVLDAHGVVRARWVGGVTPAQLAQYVAGARAGRSTIYISPAQKNIDAVLARANFTFTGNAAAIDKQIVNMNKAIAHAEELAEKNDKTVDYERTEHAEGTLRLAAGNALAAVATTTHDKVAALKLIAGAEGNRNQWAQAAAAYQRALALTPNDPKLVAALSRAYYRLHDYDGMIAQAKRYTELKPNDGDGWSDLGLAYQRTKQFAQAVPAYEKSIALLKADAVKAYETQDALHDGTEDANADVADTSLDLADVYVSLGDATNAQRAFNDANTYGDKLDPQGSYVRLKRNIKERTQEGMVAVALAGGDGKPVAQIAPWTGPDLPGSLPSTLKYRLIVAATADADVTLQATGLRPDWIASFCADGLCSPQTVSFRAPPSGVKTYEFQLVPPAAGATPGHVSIAVAGGSTVPVPPLK
jgi:tetratricopeptide (TPR) repeat protein/peroxiredoxin